MATPCASGKETRVRTRILEAAVEVMGAPRPARGTLRAVCERAGCSASMIRYHFGGKSGLSRAAQEHCFEPLVREIGAKAAQPVNTALYIRFWELYVQVRRLARTFPDAFRILRGQLLDEPDQPAYGLECRNRLSRTIAGLISQGMTGGDLRPGLDRAAVADWFLLFCAGADAYGPSGEDRDTFARFDLFWRGIAHPGSQRCRSTP